MMKKHFTLITSLLLFSWSAIAQVSVTFQVDMTQEEISEDGVFVTGNWMDDAGLGGEWEEPGSNEDARMTDGNGNGIYTLTVMLPAGEYQYKYANGSGFVNAEAGGDSDNYQADLSDCGGVDNGFGGYNRTMTVPEGASELTLQLFVFNACELTSSTSAPISTIRGISIAPNPMSSYALITIDNPSFTKHDVTIYDMMGRAVRQFRQVQTNVEIQRSDLVAGMYHAVFSNEKGEVMTAKFIVR